jgi:hypothetical protein
MKLLLTALLVLSFVVGNAGADERARLDNVKTEWQNAYGAIIYTVLAEVKNVSAAPIRYVKVKVELVDKDGKTVAERVGYNAGAEVLEVVVEGAAKDPAENLKQVKPIAPGATDLVRISFDKADIGKPFRKANVSVVEVR